MQIIIGTKNKGKISEIRSIYRQWLGKRKSFLKLIPLSDFPNVPDVKETGRNYLDNARKKALSWARYTGQIVLAEDSGIEIEALNWRPGIRSARFASNDKHRNATDKENHAKLLAALSGLCRRQRRARYRCIAVLAHPKKGVLAGSDGTCHGYIAQKPAGTNGFGYDPLFCPEEKSYADTPAVCEITAGYSRLQLHRQPNYKTFGQIPAYIKNRLSHRGKAIRKIFQELSKILDTAFKSH